MVPHRCSWRFSLWVVSGDAHLQIFQNLAYEAGYAVMIANTGQNGSKELPEIRSLLDRQVDGIAAYGVRKQETVDLLLEANVRTVSMNWHLDEQTNREPRWSGQRQTRSLGLSAPARTPQRLHEIRTSRSATRFRSRILDLQRWWSAHLVSVQRRE